MNTAQRKGFPLAGLLSNVMAENLAKLSLLMTNDDTSNLTRPDIYLTVMLHRW